MQSLEQLDFPRHYIGLNWFDVDESQKSTHINNLIEKHGETHGLVIEGEEIDGLPKSSIGFSEPISLKCYSAAAIVAKAICIEYSNAFFVQKLPDGKYWYLLVIDKKPAGGHNDVILSSIDDVVDNILDHYNIFDLTDRKIRYVLPPEVTEQISCEFSEAPEAYQSLSYETICEAIESESFAQIKPLSKVLSSNPLKGIRKNHIIILALAAAIAGGYAYINSSPKTEEEVIDIEKYFNKGKSSNLVGGKPTISREQLIRNNQAIATIEEAQWLSQRLTAANPTLVLNTFIEYVRSLPMNVGGWYPLSITLNTEATITAESSSRNDFATQQYYHVLSTKWRNGGTTVADFRDAIDFEGHVEYTLSGQDITTKNVIEIPPPAQLFDDNDAFVFLNNTTGEYLNILSFVQDMTIMTKGKVNGTVTPHRKTQRDIPFIDSINNIEVSDPQIDYTIIEVNLSFGGFGYGYKQMIDLSNRLSRFPHMIIKNITFNLETEETQIAIQFIHESEILNQQIKGGKEK